MWTFDGHCASYSGNCDWLFKNRFESTKRCVETSRQSVLALMLFSYFSAYSAYSLVWQEYKRMGQDFHKHIDQDTVSAIQFGYDLFIYTYEPD